MVLELAAVVAAGVAVLSGPPPNADINSCKYLTVGDFTDDPYGIAPEIRRQARLRGFTVIGSLRELSQTELPKACVMLGNWSANGFGGHLTMHVVDALSGATVADADAGATNWWTVSKTVKAGVSKLFDQLHYTGFNEAAMFARLHRVYPLRPKLDVTEEFVRGQTIHSQVEGIWTDTDDKYRLAVVPATNVAGADYVAVILRSSTPLWEPGEIKAEIRRTASPAVFTMTYYAGNKQAVGTTLTIDGAILRSSITIQGTSSDVVLMRVWPAMSEPSPAPREAATSVGGVTGTGFVVSAAGLIATNWHVVQDARTIDIVFPGSQEPISLELVVRDPSNDLALLRPASSSGTKVGCRAFPYQLTRSSGVALGAKVSTIGYPLQSILGNSPKYSEGVVSSRAGFQDDPRAFQISAAVQPGSSGGPLFDANGNVVGIIVATLDGGKLYADVGALPQNVNWAIKSDYLLNLLNMLPNEHLAERTVAFTPEVASACVGLVHARQ